MHLKISSKKCSQKQFFFSAHSRLQFNESATWCLSEPLREWPSKGVGSEGCIEMAPSLGNNLLSPAMAGADKSDLIAFLIQLKPLTFFWAAKIHLKNNWTKIFCSSSKVTVVRAEKHRYSLIFNHHCYHRYNIDDAYCISAQKLMSLNKTRLL